MMVGRCVSQTTVSVNWLSDSYLEVNVQSLSSHERIMALDLPHGGHISHGYQAHTKKKITREGQKDENLNIVKLQRTMPHSVRNKTRLGNVELSLDDLEIHSEVNLSAFLDIQKSNCGQMNWSYIQNSKIKLNCFQIVVYQSNFYKIDVGAMLALVLDSATPGCSDPFIPWREKCLLLSVMKDGLGTHVTASFSAGFVVVVNTKVAEGVKPPCKGAVDCARNTVKAEMDEGQNAYKGVSVKDTW
ncbi:mitochondrial dicarboxylate carrier [Tanacetum coccineum]|uniref:Mitochondrial dicarboxylate carrier n=1 Tax=Tanacetum coccineum TaxID=301880 RepID=A0ABQ5FRS8_9ASTR